MKRNPPLPPDFWSEIEASPHRQSFYNLLRWIDARVPMRRPLGRNSSPAHEPVRLKQEPSMAFAPSTISKVQRPEGRVPEVSFLHFGLFGPNGPLPLHLTELARERLIHHRDPTIAAFADIFHHRLLTLFYRAWADAQAAVSLDSGKEDFSRFLGSLIHEGLETQKNRDSIHHHAKLHFAGHLVRQSRNPEGLVNIIRTYFGIEAKLEEFVVHWLEIDPEKQFRLGSEQPLGREVIMGRAVRDAHSKFRIVLGPLSEEQYQSFLPGSENSQLLVDWVRQYIGVELSWDVVLTLKRNEVNGIHLGKIGSLGLNSWLGQRSSQNGDAQDLIVDYEQRLRLHKQKTANKASLPIQEPEEFKHIEIV